MSDTVHVIDGNGGLDACDIPLYEVRACTRNIGSAPLPSDVGHLLAEHQRRYHAHPRSGGTASQ